MNKLPISEIKENPKNPRIIKDYKFDKLLKSVKEFPEMTEIRPVVINKDNMIIGGNMRFKAMKEAGWTEIPVIQVDLSKEKEEEFIIKDNVTAGEWDWDALANEWDTKTLNEWALNTPFNTDILDIDDKPTTDVEAPKAPKTTDDDYSVFDMMMLYENKIELLEILRIVKEKENIEKQEAALMFIIKRFKENYND